jgi:hypothetical protein
MKACSGKLFALVLLLIAAATVAVAQDMPQAFLLRRFAIAPNAYMAPSFTVAAFRASAVEEVSPRNLRTASADWTLAALPAQTARPFNLPLLRSLEKDRLVAMVAGAVPALARAFDEDSAPKGRFSASPLIDLDDGRVGVQVKIRLSR